MKTLLLTIFIALFYGCSDQKHFKVLPTGPIKHHLIALARTNNGIRVRGFAKATPSGTQILCETGKTKGQTISGANGSFNLPLGGADPQANSAQLTFDVAGKSYVQTYQVKNLSSSLQNIAKEAFSTEKELSALDFIHDQRVAILSAQASLVQIFDIDQYWQIQQVNKSILLARDNDPMPFSLVTRKNFAVVSMWNSHEITVLDLNRAQVIASAKVKDDKDKLYVFDLKHSLSVITPIDADDSGKKDTTIHKSMARNAESILALDDTHFLVSFVNYYQFEIPSLAQKSVVGPGVIALMSLVNNQLKTNDRKVLPCKNPRYFTSKDKYNVYVTCCGAFVNVGQSTVSSNEAGLVRLKLSADYSSFSIDHHIPLPFAPAEPDFVDGRMIIPHNYKNELVDIDENAVAINAADTKKLKSKASFTLASHWHDKILFIADASGKLIAYSLDEGFLPFPFTEPIVINKAIDEKVGLNIKAIYFRHKINKLDLKTDYAPGYGAWVLSDVHHRIFPLDFLAVLGP